MIFEYLRAIIIILVTIDLFFCRMWLLEQNQFIIITSDQQRD